MRRTLFLSALLLSASAAQADNDMANMDMGGMDHGAMNHGAVDGMAMPSTGILGAYPMSRDASGTSWQPDAAEHNGIHLMAGDWMLMTHLRLTGVYDMQDGPRGENMGFAEGMAMLMARRDLDADDALQLRAMLSPDPFMGKRGYPLLLQTGETADGVTHLLDRQHPHDLFMELSGTYSHRFTGDNAAFVYLGYPGEPALGPAAFMHRASGSDNPAAPLAHHWLDSTHITFGVATLGFVHDDWKLEVSQFTGREPDQYRFNFDPIRFDSTAARVSWNPEANWSLQASWGYLKSPEQLAPLVNETRLTASATYVLPLGEASSFAATLAFGHKQLTGGDGESAVLFEAEYKPADLWTIFARTEMIETEELVPGPIRTVGEATLGAIRDFRVSDHWKVGLGASHTFNFVPSALSPPYDNDPRGTMLFARIVAE